MRSAPPARTCELCGHQGTLSLLIRGTREDHSFVTCSRCGLTSLHPLPTEADLVASYADGGFSHHVSAGVKADHRATVLTSSPKHAGQLRAIQSICPGTWADEQVLDMGAGYGRLSGTLATVYPQARVWAAEPEHELADLMRARNRHPNVTVAEWTLPTVPPAFDSTFGAIFLCTVFEHLPDPVGALAHARRLVRDGGWVFILVPDLMDPGSRYGPRTFFHTAHMFYYTDKTLPALLERCGFEAVAVLRSRDISFASGAGLLAAARKRAEPLAPTVVQGLEHEAARVRRRVKSVMRVGRVTGPARQFWNYRVRLPVLRTIGSVRTKVGLR